MPDWKAKLRERLAGLRLPAAREAEIVEELAQHLEDFHAEAMSGGASVAEAERAVWSELSAGGRIEG